MDGDITKRMGENIGRAFKIADEGYTRASNITYNASNITRMSWPDGKYGMAGVVHRESEECICRASEGSD
jgi:hypothetical protein